jgi:DNA topoisomerase IA
VIGVTRKALPAGENIHRAKFSSITPDALQTAFKTLGRPNELLSRSVDVRQELDLRVGVAITRLLTWRTLSVAKKKRNPVSRLNHPK